MRLKLAAATTILFLLAAFFPSYPICAADDTSPPHDNLRIDEEVERIASAYGVRGCSIAAFAGEEIVYQHSWGTAALRNDVHIPAADDTKYRIASISKMISGILAMSLVEADSLHLEDELGAIHRGLYYPLFPDAQPTLLNLLTHTSGMYDTDAYKQVIEDGTPFPSLTALLSAQSPYSGNRPGSVYHYTNFGMGLIAAAIEQATGERFHEYANRVLFAPLGIDGGYLTDYVADKSTIADLPAIDPVSWGNMKGAYNAIPMGESYLLAHGEVYISAADLARILMLLAGDGSFQGRRYLDKDTVSLINKVHFSAGPVRRGLGIQMVDGVVEDIRLHGHQGNAYGAISCAFYDPLSNRGVVFLSNGVGAAMAENQVYHINNEMVRAVWTSFAPSSIRQKQA